ncbi:YfbU family protein [Leuconostoc carnosum]|uniref:YfbU family protein n=1 Tax=Leuconostoc carnosum TaxID=1252 RepID=UPI001239A364|nr:YfbU family protein [Leuconostoc carnosum]KAA8327063.1 hypothetical protein FE409_08100 [Leuconostoc carnosum]
MLDITETERLILTNQYKILSELSINKDDGSKEIYDELFEVFNNGYTSNYDDVTTNPDYFVYDENILDNDGQEEVRDLIAMYQYLLNHFTSAKSAYKNLPDIRFVGYDLNDSYEGKKLGYMGFIFDTLKSYPDVNEAFGHASERNSHGDTYAHEKMLQKYLEVRHNDDFYKETDKYVKEIIEAK